ncbi:hypothetical protein D3C71_2089640 [compost metagenome]
MTSCVPLRARSTTGVVPLPMPSSAMAVPMARVERRKACLPSSRSLRAKAPKLPRLRKLGQLPLSSRCTRPPSWSI